MNKKEVFGKKEMIDVILVLGIILLSIWLVYINLVQYKIGLNADVASDGILARVMWESKEWIPDEWYIASETRLIGIANIAAIFYGLTNDICLSMGLACLSGTLFILWSLVYLCKELEFSRTQKLLVVLGALLLPNNKEQLELLFIFAAYYSVHIGVFFATIAVFVKFLKDKKIKKYQMIVIAFLHTLLGAQGVRGLLMITGPLMAVEILRRSYLFYCERKWKKRIIRPLFL